MATPPDRRAIILDKAAELFAHKGIAATTVREIGDAAGILSGSIYHHFDSKDTIIDAIVSSYFDDMLAGYAEVLRSEREATERLRGLIRSSLRCAADHPHASELYQRDRNHLRETDRFAYVGEAVASMRRTWLSVIEDGVSAGAFRGDIRPRVLYPIIRDGLWHTVEWFRPTASYGTDDLAEDCFALFHQALAVPVPAAPVAHAAP
ncbi:TetR/AcrR family transcriptional regulator [Conexibacter woesei]|uniref:TetR/AcrR family transcriptional regulator n=1 Tax=Conexibacter woesei TaxID=191495 RepID=UPI0002FF2037|nr:TetR/AcrR family transcriptional regulator [Conexibacter woesei]